MPSTSTSRRTSTSRGSIASSHPVAPSPVRPFSRWALIGLLVAACLAPAPAGAGEAPDPRAGWRFAFKEFVIAAWSPPGAADAEYRLYRDAGFNLIMAPRYAFPQASLDLAQKHGLKVMIDTYTPNDKPWGGTAGPYTPHPSHHPATLPELKWLHELIGAHPALAGYLLGDDIGKIPAELQETTDFLRQRAPHLFPWICQCTYAYESLAKVGNPIADPQIYPTLYQKNLPAVAQRDAYCRTLEALRRSCRKLRMVSWPMFNVCGTDEYGKPGAVSDAFLRLQPYTALAYGAQGIWYFTFGCLYRNGEAGPESTPALEVVKGANRRIAGWGPRLLGCDPVGVFHTDFPGGTALAPGEGRIIRRMSSHLLAGLLVAPNDTVYAVVVDKRVAGAPEEMAPRKVTLTFGPEVQSVSLAPPQDTAPSFPGAQGRGTGAREGGPGGLGSGSGTTGMKPVAPSGYAVGRPHGRRSASPSGGRSAQGSEQRVSYPLLLTPGEGQLLLLRGRGLAAKARALANQESRLPKRAGKVGPDGLVINLSFDEGQGTRARDTSGGGNDASLSDGAGWAPGKVGGALDLRGPADAAGVADAFLPTRDEITVACWVNPTYPKQGYGPVFLLGSGGIDRVEFGFGPDNLYPVLSGHASHSESRLYLDGMKALIPEGTWGHIAVAAGPKGAALYVNGEARRATDYAGRFDFDLPMLTLGCRQGENYTGLIDDVRVYNRCLSSEEIRRLYQGGE